MKTSSELETFRRAFDFALNDLIVQLTEAQTYLGGANDRAAIGTLVDLDNRVDDLKAALRLFLSSMRRL